MSNLTKLALEQSLKRFLLKKPLDKITIKDLTDDVGISRMSFYYHFKDIYDLVEWSCIYDATNALKGNGYEFLRVVFHDFGKLSSFLYA